MHWYAVILVYFHWSLLNWRNFVAYSFCWYMIQFSIFCFVLFFFDLIIVIILLWYLEYGVCFFCRQVLLTCPNAFVVLKIKISWFLIPDSNQLSTLISRNMILPCFSFAFILRLKQYFIFAKTSCTLLFRRSSLDESYLKTFQNKGAPLRTKCRLKHRF